MIRVTLEPTQLVVDQPSELTIRLTNIGRGPCTNVVFKLTLPVQVVLLQGPDRVEIVRLDAGQSATHTVRVRPKHAGVWALTSANFSYRDARGQSRRITDLRLDVTAVPMAPAPVTPEPGPAVTPPIAPPAKPTRMLRVFLCHSSTDKPAVRDLYQRLRADGIDAWLDEENLLPGQDWQQEIPKAVRTSDVVIVCLSRGSITKAGYVQKEIKYALDVADEQPEGTIFLIPLKLEECDVPERLRRWQWVNFFEERGCERLMRALRARASTLGITVSR